MSDSKSRVETDKTVADFLLSQRNGSAGLPGQPAQHSRRDDNGSAFNRVVGGAIHIEHPGGEFITRTIVNSDLSTREVNFKCMEGTPMEFDPSMPFRVRYERVDAAGQRRNDKQRFVAGGKGGLKGKLFQVTRPKKNDEGKRPEVMTEKGVFEARMICQQGHTVHEYTRDLFGVKEQFRDEVMGGAIKIGDGPTIISDQLRWIVNFTVVDYEIPGSGKVIPLIKREFVVYEVDKNTQERNRRMYSEAIDKWCSATPVERATRVVDGGLPFPRPRPEAWFLVPSQLNAVGDTKFRVYPLNGKVTKVKPGKLVCSKDTTYLGG
jgi:hypothetical protein